MNTRQRIYKFLTATHKKRALLRSLVNIRPPKPVSEEFLSVQDAFLQEETKAKGSVRLKIYLPVHRTIGCTFGKVILPGLRS